MSNIVLYVVKCCDIDILIADFYYFRHTSDYKG